MTNVSFLEPDEINQTILGSANFLRALGLSAITISSVGFDSLGFYRSMIRAQRLLFLAAGIIIHPIKGNQDIRYGHLNEIVGAIFCLSIRSSTEGAFLSGLNRRIFTYYIIIYFP